MPVLCAGAQANDHREVSNMKTWRSTDEEQLPFVPA
jgi:hypothetical protein